MRRLLRGLMLKCVKAGWFSGVGKTTVFVRGMDGSVPVNRIYAEFFGSPYPARPCVEVSKLPKGAAIEVEAIAVS